MCVCVPIVIGGRVRAISEQSPSPQPHESAKSSDALSHQSHISEEKAYESPLNATDERLYEYKQNPRIKTMQIQITETQPMFEEEEDTFAMGNKEDTYLTDIVTKQAIDRKRKENGYYYCFLLLLLFPTHTHTHTHT